jgi:dihydroorotate dehydrogenase electron transfer subunit
VGQSGTAPPCPFVVFARIVVDHVAPPLAAQRTVNILENLRVARDTFRMRLDDPAMARAIRPGQFLMVRPSLGSDPLLGRPFALYDVARDASGTPVAVDVVYLILGRGTASLAEKKPGERVSIWGPLGNGFGEAPGGPAVFIAGGIGQTPFLALAKWWTGQAEYGETRPTEAVESPRASLLYGVRSADLLAGLDDFASAGMDVEVATDDGSAGHRGFVTDLLRARIARGEPIGKLVACGPPPMLSAVARIAEEHGIACDLSLENHMACGFGACFSCVAPIRQEDGSTDLKRVCVEGPIFGARSVVFA